MQCYSIPADRLEVERNSFAMGGFGAVKLATLLPPAGSQNEQLTVVVEELRVDTSQVIPLRVAYRLVRETMVWSACKHANILEFLGYHLGEDFDPAYLVSPHMKNGNIRDYLAANEVELPKLLELVQGTIKGLEYLHSKIPPIVHGDLKAIMTKKLPYHEVKNENLIPVVMISNLKTPEPSLEPVLPPLILDMIRKCWIFEEQRRPFASTCMDTVTAAITTLNEKASRHSDSDTAAAQVQRKRHRATKPRLLANAQDYSASAPLPGPRQQDISRNSVELRNSQETSTAAMTSKRPAIQETQRAARLTQASMAALNPATPNAAGRQMNPRIQPVAVAVGKRGISAQPQFQQIQQNFIHRIQRERTQQVDSALPQIQHQSARTAGYQVPPRSGSVLPAPQNNAPLRQPPSHQLKLPTAAAGAMRQQASGLRRPRAPDTSVKQGQARRVLDAQYGDQELDTAELDDIKWDVTEDDFDLWDDAQAEIEMLDEAEDDFDFWDDSQAEMEMLAETEDYFNVG
ncbi:hypothetical protein FRC01_004192 [Tulasnella sp. 417]|nr:hypothetical protein FRC01_004192 [Tulasnella sp. 417]